MGDPQALSSHRDLIFAVYCTHELNSTPRFLVPSVAPAWPWSGFAWSLVTAHCGPHKDNLGPLLSDICPVLVDLFRVDVSTCVRMGMGGSLQAPGASGHYRLPNWTSVFPQPGLGAKDEVGRVLSWVGFLALQKLSVLGAHLQSQHLRAGGRRIRS